MASAGSQGFTNFMGGMASLDGGGMGPSGALGSAMTGSAGAAGGGLASAMTGGLALAGPAGMVASMVLSGVQAAAATREARDVARVDHGNKLYSSAYEKAVSDYYDRKNKGERRLALENYNQFNTMEEIAPGYKDVYQPAELGNMPSAVDYTAHRKQKNNIVKEANQQAQINATVGSVTLPGG